MKYGQDSKKNETAVLYCETGSRINVALVHEGLIQETNGGESELTGDYQQYILLLN